jgi:hypothetical protein
MEFNRGLFLSIKGNVIGSKDLNKVDLKRLISGKNKEGEGILDKKKTQRKLVLVREETIIKDGEPLPSDFFHFSSVPVFALNAKNIAFTKDWKIPTSVLEGLSAHIQKLHEFGEKKNEPKRSYKLDLNHVVICSHITSNIDGKQIKWVKFSICQKTKVAIWILGLM